MREMFKGYLCEWGKIKSILNGGLLEINATLKFKQNCKRL